MLRLEILQTKKLNRSIGETRVAWRSVTEGTTSNKPCRRQFAHIVQRCGIAVHEFTVNVFGKISAANARLRDVFKRRLRTRSDALRGECEPCDRRISPMCESLTKTGALMFVPAYLSLLLAMAVPFAPGDALRFLLLSLCFMFLGAGVAFLVASDIVRGR